MAGLDLTTSCFGTSGYSTASIHLTRLLRAKRRGAFFLFWHTPLTREHDASLRSHAEKY
jgi:hypothetical protein